MNIQKTKGKGHWGFGLEHFERGGWCIQFAKWCWYIGC